MIITLFTATTTTTTTTYGTIIIITTTTTAASYSFVTMFRQARYPYLPFGLQVPCPVFARLRELLFHGV